MLNLRDRVLFGLTFGGLGALGAVLLVGLWLHPLRENGLDFQAFYCGAKALTLHANPYLNQPLHDCERATSPSFFAMYPNVTVPAPLPPYALALFVPLALLPFAAAKTLWFAAMVALTALAVWITAKLARLPLSVALAALGVAMLGPTVLQLALAPLPIALLVLGAFCVSRARWNAAAVCITAAMIEPHVALPAALALFCWVPAMRLRLLAGGLAAAALALAATGPQTALWYLTVLLPGHAGSELNNLGQFSLTSLLYHAGVAGPVALRAGSLQYALMLGFGVWIGRVLSKRFGDPAFLVTGAAACSVVGGAFIHLSEIAVAIPLACMLAQRTRSHAAWIALALLAVPWEAIFNWAFLAPFGLMSLAWVVWYRWRPMPLLLLLGSLGALLISLRLHEISVREFLSAHVHSNVIPAAPAGASSDVTWAAFNALAPGSSFWWLEKSLTLAALGIVVWLLLRIARARALAQDNLIA